MDHRIEIACCEFESEPAKCLRIADLSRTLNLSASRFRHLFKSETGQTLSQFVKHVRLEAATVLLKTTFLSVKEIMNGVGISSDSHFAHDFKAAYGLSPTQYRKLSSNTAQIETPIEDAANLVKEQPIPTRLADCPFNTDPIASQPLVY
jgi:AraC family transcriptional regulator of arabinose operon